MCSSVFEVSILMLNNNRGVNQYGRCCAGSRTTPPCTEECQTYFSVCLMHYIQVYDHITVDSQIFVRIMFSRKALKDIHVHVFATLKIRTTRA